MHSLNWSPQKPEQRTLERDEKAIARCQQKDGPRIKTLPGWCPPGLRRRIGRPVFRDTVDCSHSRLHNTLWIGVNLPIIKVCPSRPRPVS
jgi:hypothetical protein